MPKIERALNRFKELVDSLECECDPYHGYTCPLHNDKTLAAAALAEYAVQPTVAAGPATAHECPSNTHGGRHHWVPYMPVMGSKCTLCGKVVE